MNYLLDLSSILLSKLSNSDSRRSNIKSEGEKKHHFQSLSNQLCLQISFFTDSLIHFTPYRINLKLEICTFCEVQILMLVQAERIKKTKSTKIDSIRD